MKDHIGANDPGRYARVKALFEVVCDLSAEDRERTLSQFAAVDPHLTWEVKRLIAFHDPVQARVEGEQVSGFRSSKGTLTNRHTYKSSTGLHSLSSAPAGMMRFGLGFCKNCKLGGLPCFVVAALLVAAIIFLANTELKRQVWAARVDEVERIADTFEQMVKNQIDTKLQHFVQLSQSPRIAEAIDYMLERKTPDSLHISPNSERSGYLARELILRKQLTLQNYGPVQFILRNRAGFVIAYSLTEDDEAELVSNLDTPDLHDFSHVSHGEPYMHLPHKKWAKLKNVYLQDSEDKDIQYQFADVWFIIPIFDSQRQIKAVLSVRDATADDDLKTVSEYLRFGETGEVIPFDESGIAIAPTRFDSLLAQYGLLAEGAKTAAMNYRLVEPEGNIQDPDSKIQPSGRLLQPVALAIAQSRNHKYVTKKRSNPIVGQDEAGATFLVAKDYRGISCLTHYRWLEECGFGFVAKLDEDEAYRLPVVPSHMLLYTLASLFLFAIIVKSVLVIKRWHRGTLVGQVVGQYEIIAKIAEGGMGVVYKARHQMLGRPAAIKVLRKGMLDLESRNRFDREVRLVSKLRCKHTICIYDYGTSNRGEPYFAMELLQGVTLDRAINDQGPFTEAKALKHMIEIALSLREAHRMGIIHRDLAPQNVMLTSDMDGEQSVVVIDFGLARPVENRESSVDKPKRQWAGTPGFMAPERIRNPNNADPRSDIFSLGAVGAFMLSGKAPVAEAGFNQAAGQALSGQDCVASYAPVASTSPGGSVFLSLILKSLSADPIDRPQTMDEFLVLAQQLQAIKLAGDLPSPPLKSDDASRFFGEKAIK